MDLHPLPRFQAAPGMPYLPAAPTSAYPARYNANQAASRASDLERWETTLLPCGQATKKLLLLLDRLKDAPGESTTGR